MSQARAGFEADRWVLNIRERRGINQSPVPMSGYLDRSVQSFVFGDSGVTLYAVLDDVGGQSIAVIWPFSNHHPDAEKARAIRGGVNTSVSVAPFRGDKPAFANLSQDLIFLRSRADHPAEVYTAKANGQGRRPLTHHNDDLVAKLDVSKAEGFTFQGADGDEVHGWLIKPPGFDPSKKYPVLFAIHGGPQGAWHDEWHARWNYQMFAAPGYAVVAINPRGSTGYGQKFTDQISKDWTGRVYEDLNKGLDHALKSYPFLDEKRVAAAGGSYGGFMVNWIAGHSDRFKALISHAGVFDLTSKYGTTEELWFPDWEFGGPPWSSKEVTERYREQSPSSYVANFKTPTLVIHGALDFRVPDAQGLGMFTALQRMKVPSRYVFFPDEGHWILKPANRVAWWREMHSWLEKYL
jgi:dipeptidyl aminopeptidase/acylaminoacyl peptidase